MLKVVWYDEEKTCVCMSNLTGRASAEQVGVSIIREVHPNTPPKLHPSNPHPPSPLPPPHQKKNRIPVTFLLKFFRPTGHHQLSNTLSSCCGTKRIIGSAAYAKSQAWIRSCIKVRRTSRLRHRGKTLSTSLPLTSAWRDVASATSCADIKSRSQLLRSRNRLLHLRTSDRSFRTEYCIDRRRREGDSERTGRAYNPRIL